MPLTKEQLTLFEPAARDYCAKTGAEPDRVVQVPHPLGLPIPLSVKLWERIAEELCDLGFKLQALKLAGAPQPNKPKIKLVGGHDA